MATFAALAFFSASVAPPDPAGVVCNSFNPELVGKYPSVEAVCERMGA